MAKRYRVSNPPSPSLASTGEYLLPSDRIQGNKDCIFCGSKTLSYKGVCRKCKWAVSPERIAKLTAKREGQVLALAQEKIWEERDKRERQEQRLETMD